MIVYGGAAHTASAAIFHQGNKEVVVLTEKGDTLTGIARDAVHTYGLANNVGRCTSALIQEVHGVSVRTYRQNPKKYDRNFQPDQVYVLPNACVNGFLKGKVIDKTQTTPVPAYTVQHVVPTTAHPVTVAISEIPTQSATPGQISPELPAPAVTEEVVPSQPQVLAYYSIPSLPTPVLDDEGYRTNRLQNVITCANHVTDMEWVPNLPQVVYDTGTEVMRSLARKVCGDERDVASHFQQPNAG